MDRRLGFWVSSVGALLAVSLVAAPIWDFWKYRSLRAPLGPHVPVGVILPLRTVGPSTATGPAHRDEAVTLVAELARKQGGAAATARSEATRGAPFAGTSQGTMIAGFSSPGGVVPSPVPARPHAVPVPRPGERAEARPASSPLSPGHVDHAQERPAIPPGAEPETAAKTSTGETPSVGTAPGDPGGTFVTGWPAAPAPDHEPQLPPEPRPGPPPPPSSTPPRYTTTDPPSTTQAIPTLTLTPPAGTVKVGDAFSVTVRLSTGTSVSSLPFHVAFDPAVLQFQSAERGPAIGASMQTILLASVSPARPGDLAVGLSLVDSGPMLQGSGTVLRLNFVALAPGSSALAFDRATIRGSMSEPLDAQFHDTRIDVH